VRDLVLQTYAEYEEIVATVERQPASSGCPSGHPLPLLTIALGSSEAFMSGAHEIGTVSTFSVDPGDDSLLTPQDAARFLKVSVSWVYEHVRPEAQDRLPFVKLG